MGMDKKFMTVKIFRFFGDLKHSNSGIMAIVGLILLLTFIFIAIFAPIISPFDPTKRAGRSLMAPNSKFIFGTDNLGRDMFSRIVYGTRIALSIAFISVLVAASIGIPLGLLSGYIGGWIDRTLTLIMDAIYSFPGLILAIAIAAMLGPGVFNIALSIAVVYAPTYFRVIRNQVTSAKSHLYVEAARAIGAKNHTILLRYILPNVMPSVVVVLSMNLADAIMTEAGLSFLGLGIAPPTPDWGYDLNNGQRFMLYNCWWLLLFPGLSIITAVLGFSLFSEGMNEHLNPNVGERR